jgi:hypothetical protein
MAAAVRGIVAGCESKYYFAGRHKNASGKPLCIAVLDDDHAG